MPTRLMLGTVARMTAPKAKKSPPNAPQGASVVVGKKVRTDWEAVERDYRTDTFTLRELAAKHGLTHTTISRRADKGAWSKDLTKAIRQATSAKLVQQSVQQECTSAHQNATDTVLAAAEVNKDVILGHRRGLNRITEIKVKLLEQIEQAAANMTDLADIIEMVRNPDDNGIDRANDALKKAMGRSALVDDLKKLADVDEKVRKGEREAFSLDDAPEDTSTASTSRYTDAERAVKLAYLMSQVPST